MDLELYFNNIYEYETLMKKILKICKSYKIKADYKKHETYCNVGLDFCGVLLSFGEPIGLSGIIKDYHTQVNCCLDIQMYNKTAKEKIGDLLKILGKLFRSVKGDYVLLENGDILIARRKDGKLETYDNEGYYKYKLPIENLL